MDAEAFIETDVPDISLAQERLRMLLETDPRTGELLPLDAPLSAFFEIGTGISAYMRLINELRSLFWFLFLLALANLITNIFGGALGSAATIFTVASIANAPRLTPAYGAMEAVAGYVLTHGIPVILGRLRAQAEQIDRDELTAADFCLEVRGVPMDADHPDFADRIAESLSELCGVHDGGSGGGGFGGGAGGAIEVVSVAVPVGTHRAIQTAALQAKEAARAAEMAHFLQVATAAGVHSPMAALGSPRGAGPSSPRSPMIRTAADVEAVHVANAPNFSALRVVQLEAEYSRSEKAARRLAAEYDEMAARGETTGCHAGVAYVTLKDEFQALKVLSAMRDGGKQCVLRPRPTEGDAGDGAGDDVRHLVPPSVPPSPPSPPAEEAFTEAGGAEAGAAEGGAAEGGAAGEGEGEAVEGAEASVPPLPIPLVITRAPEPDDVLWANLPCSSGERRWRQALLVLFSLSLASVGTVLIVTAQYWIPKLAARASSVGDPLLAALVIQGSSTACILAGNLPIFILVPMLEQKLARHRTTSALEAATVVKLIFFQVLNTACASSVFALDTGGQLSREWYASGASLVLSTLLGDFFIIQLGVDLMQPGILIGRYLAAPGSLTQREMDEYAPNARTAHIHVPYASSSALLMIWRPIHSLTLHLAHHPPIVLLAGRMPYAPTSTWSSGCSSS